jgi:hypothetical protein
MKERVRSLTSCSNGWGNGRRKLALRQFIYSWVNYYKLADMKILLRQIDEWYRIRLTTRGNLEAMEAGKNAVAQSYKARLIQIQGVAVCQYEEKLLAYSQ